MTKKIQQTNIDSLNKRFSNTSAEQNIYIDAAESALPILHVNNQFSQIKVSLQGAHILSWFPKDKSDVIWMSSQTRLLPNKSLRGGIPICWPWFGAHEKETKFPAHGFARTVMWRLQDIKILDNDETQISLQLNMQDMDKNIQTMWPYACDLEYIITVGKTLKLKLITHNNSQQDIKITQALHSYFNIGDITKTQVLGLEGLEYLDKPDAFKRKKQYGAVNITEEVDRIYLQTQDDIVIKTSAKKIRLSAQGSQSTVVWNPWKIVAEKMADLGDDGYLTMLCVETANAADDFILVAAGERHVLAVEYSI